MKLKMLPSSLKIIKKSIVKSFDKLEEIGDSPSERAMELKMLPSSLKIIKKSIIKSFDKLKEIGDFPSERPLGKAKMVSSAHGKIKTLLFVLPNNGQGPARYDIYKVFRELVSHMKTIKTFIVLHHGNEFKEEWGLKLLNDYPNKIHPLKINPGDKLDIWIQDHFYPINYINNNEQHTYLVAGKKISSHYKKIIYNLLINPNGINTTRPTNNQLKFIDSPLPFEGGNILTGDDFVFVGEDSRYNNDTLHSTSDYKEWFGHSPIFIKGEIPVMNSFPSSDGFVNLFPKTQKYKQPLLHIDMFISLAGYNKEKEYIIVVGEPMLDPEFPSNVPNDLFDCVHNWLSEIKTAIESIIIMLKEQTSKKFKIVRTPLVLTYKDDVIEKNEIKKVRHWFWATYNNCLVEIINAKNGQQGSKKVWLPSYGGATADYSNRYMKDKDREKIAKEMNCSALKITYGNWSNLSKYDDWNERVWKGLGFETFLLKKNYIPFVHRGGALNCITNCIEREM